MSLILMIVLAIIAIFAFSGWKNGLIKTVVSLASIIIAMIICSIVTPIMSKMIREKTDVYATIEKTIYQYMSDSEEFDEAIQESVEISEDIDVDDIDENINEDIDGQTGKLSDLAENVASKMGLPAGIVNNIDEFFANGSIEESISESEFSLRNVTAALVSASLASIVLNAIVYVIVFIVVWTILKIIAGVTNIISRLPVIRQVNKVAGLCVGLVESLVIIWVMFAIITACASMPWATSMLMDIGNNALLNFLYNNNLIFKSLTLGV